MASILKTDKIEGVTASGTVAMPAGFIVGYTKSDYTSTSLFASTDQLTLDSPLDGTFSYTTKLASSLLRVHVHFAPVRQFSTWGTHAFRMFQSTSGSGGSYTQFYLGTNLFYNESNSFNADNVDLCGHISAGSAGTTYNIKLTVEGHTNGRTFQANQYVIDSTTVVTDANSFISVMEIAQ
tara:strand:+ start:554 stop:1093 length:540 start_codon:yes stop_codon:yes gene_type:complete